MSTSDLIVIFVALLGLLGQAVGVLAILWLKSTMKGSKEMQDEKFKNIEEQNSRQEEHHKNTDHEVEKLRVGQQDHEVRITVIEGDLSRGHGKA
jgi:hypothetical protein